VWRRALGCGHDDGIDRTLTIPNKLIFEDGARGSTPRRGGRRKVGHHGSDRNNDGNRLMAAAAAKNGDSGENDTEGGEMAGFRCSSKKKIL